MRLSKEEQAAILALARDNGGTVRRTHIDIPIPVRRDFVGEKVAPGVQVLVMDDWLPLGTNSMIRSPRSKWFRKHKAARERVMAEALRQRLRPADGTARRVTIEVDWPPGRRRYDVDAFQKCVLDALQAAKLLVSDTYEFCVVMPVAYYLADRLRTVIRLEDIPAREVGPRPPESTP